MSQLVVLSPDTMSFRDQLIAVRRSRVLVGFHGAGLAHLMFLHPAASVLELSLPRYTSRINYAHISRGTGVTFMIHVLEGFQENHADETINVPVHEVVELLEWHIPRPVLA